MGWSPKNESILASCGADRRLMVWDLSRWEGGREGGREGGAGKVVESSGLRPRNCPILTAPEVRMMWLNVICQTCVLRDLLSSWEALFVCRMLPIS